MIAPSWWSAARRHPRIGSVRWCVRLDWPDGTHDLAAPCRTPAAAEQAATALQRYWSPGPAWPVSCAVVTVSRHDWRLHRDRRGCRAPDCPTTTTVAPVTGRRNMSREVRS